MLHNPDSLGATWCRIRSSIARSSAPRQSNWTKAHFHMSCNVSSCKSHVSSCKISPAQHVGSSPEAGGPLYPKTHRHAGRGTFILYNISAGPTIQFKGHDPFACGPMTVHGTSFLFPRVVRNSESENHIHGPMRETTTEKEFQSKYPVNYSNVSTGVLDQTTLKKGHVSVLNFKFQWKDFQQNLQFWFCSCGVGDWKKCRDKDFSWDWNEIPTYNNKIKILHADKIFMKVLLIILLAVKSTPICNLGHSLLSANPKGPL